MWHGGEGPERYDWGALTSTPFIMMVPMKGVGGPGVGEGSDVGCVGVRRCWAVDMGWKEGLGALHDVDHDWVFLRVGVVLHRRPAAVLEDLLHDQVQDPSGQGAGRADGEVVDPQVPFNGYHGCHEVPGSRPAVACDALPSVMLLRMGLWVRSHRGGRGGTWTG